MSDIKKLLEAKADSAEDNHYTFTDKDFSYSDIYIKSERNGYITFVFTSEDTMHSYEVSLKDLSEADLDSFDLSFEGFAQGKLENSLRELCKRDNGVFIHTCYDNWFIEDGTGPVFEMDNYATGVHIEGDPTNPRHEVIVKSDDLDFSVSGNNCALFRENIANLSPDELRDTLIKICTDGYATITLDDMVLQNSDIPDCLQVNIGNEGPIIMEVTPGQSKEDLAKLIISLNPQTAEDLRENLSENIKEFPTASIDTTPLDNLTNLMDSIGEKDAFGVYEVNGVKLGISQYNGQQVITVYSDEYVANLRATEFTKDDIETITAGAKNYAFYDEEKSESIKEIVQHQKGFYERIPYHSEYEVFYEMHNYETGCHIQAATGEVEGNVIVQSDSLNFTAKGCFQDFLADGEENVLVRPIAKLDELTPDQLKDKLINACSHGVFDILPSKTNDELCISVYSAHPDQWNVYDRSPLDCGDAIYIHDGDKTAEVKAIDGQSLEDLISDEIDKNTSVAVSIPAPTTTADEAFKKAHEDALKAIKVDVTSYKELDYEFRKQDKDLSIEIINFPEADRELLSYIPYEHWIVDKSIASSVAQKLGCNDVDEDIEFVKTAVMCSPDNFVSLKTDKGEAFTFIKDAEKLEYGNLEYQAKECVRGKRTLIIGDKEPVEIKCQDDIITAKFNDDEISIKKSIFAKYCIKSIAEHASFCNVYMSASDMHVEKEKMIDFIMHYGYTSKEDFINEADKKIAEQLENPESSEIRKEGERIAKAAEEMIQKAEAAKIETKTETLLESTESIKAQVFEDIKRLSNGEILYDTIQSKDGEMLFISKTDYGTTLIASENGWFAAIPSEKADEIVQGTKPLTKISALAIDQNARLYVMSEKESMEITYPENGVISIAVPEGNFEGVYTKLPEGTFTSKAQEAIETVVLNSAALNMTGQGLKENVNLGTQESLLATTESIKLQVFEDIKRMSNGEVTYDTIQSKDGEMLFTSKMDYGTLIASENGWSAIVPTDKAEEIIQGTRPISKITALTAEQEARIYVMSEGQSMEVTYPEKNKIAIAVPEKGFEGINISLPEETPASKVRENIETVVYNGAFSSMLGELSLPVVVEATNKELNANNQEEINGNQNRAGDHQEENDSGIEQ